MDNRKWKVVLALIFPPLAVLDKGCGTIFVVTLLTFPLWIPGMIAAILIVLADKPQSDFEAGEYDEWPEKEKRKGAYVRLADGEVAEVVEDDHAPLEGYKNDLRGG